MRLLLLAIIANPNNTNHTFFVKHDSIKNKVAIAKEISLINKCLDKLLTALSII